MKEDKYYTMHNGMEVPNGDTYQSIAKKLGDGKYKTFDLTENDGFSERLIYLGVTNGKHEFKRKFNGKTVYYQLREIHLLSEV